MKRGAEAIVEQSKFLEKSVMIKTRIVKPYRVAELDQKLRVERTRREARLLHSAKLSGVPCPVVLEVTRFSLTITRVAGKRPSMNKKECAESGRLLAKLHSNDIIHGDFTPANLINSKGKLFVIDFGLGFFSDDVEDKAIDVLTMLKSLNMLKQLEFLKGYSKYKKSKSVLKRLEQIKRRVRYA